MALAISDTTMIQYILPIVKTLQRRPGEVVMSWKHRLPREQEPEEGGLIGYRRELLLFLAVFTIAASWLPLRTVIRARLPTLSELGITAFGFALGVSTALLRRHWPRLASYFFIVGSLLLISFVCQMLGRYDLQAFLALPVLLSGLLVGWPAVLGACICSWAAIARLSPGPFLGAGMGPWLLLTLAMAGIALLTDRGLRLIDHWEREAGVGQRELILQLRDRQGDLNRALKALGEAYESLKRSRDELAQARQQADEARALKEHFVANVSHELRTPLNLIVGFAELLYLAPESYDGVVWTRDLESDIRELYRASRHLQSLVNDILDLSRIDAAKLPMFRELVDLRGIVLEAMETIAPLLRQRRLTCELDCPQEVPPLFLDRTRIRQVLLNLLNNAIRFTDQGGITIRIELAQESVRVSVRDTGVGIPADQLEHIFEEFRQVDVSPRSRGGAGLGLALSRQFVQLHGGRMWVESQVGVGSTFYFSLPLPGAVPQTTPLFYIPERKTADLQRATVIVVDPDPSIADMLSRYLGDRRVLAARNGAEAEKLVDVEHPLAIVVNQPPDAPPEEWLGALGEKSARYNVPVLRCSLPSLSWLTRSKGLDGCLTKPISREVLNRVLDEGETPRTVLVVDDDPGFLRLMERMLGTLSPASRVLKAGSGPQALRLAHENIPDLVLLDLLMPEMDGFQVLEALRGDPLLAKVRVVAVTATSYAEEALRRRGGHLTLTQALGLSAGTLTELLNAVLGVVKPSYA